MLDFNLMRFDKLEKSYYLDGKVKSSEIKARKF